MDGDPSQEDRIRLIGRLFFNISGRGLNPRSLSYLELFSFMQNLGQICRFLWAILWTYGQNRGQSFVRLGLTCQWPCVLFSRAQL